MPAMGVGLYLGLDLVLNRLVKYAQQAVLERLQIRGEAHEKLPQRTLVRGVHPTGVHQHHL